MGYGTARNYDRQNLMVECPHCGQSVDAGTEECIFCAFYLTSVNPKHKFGRIHTVQECLQCNKKMDMSVKNCLCCGSLFGGKHAKDLEKSKNHGVRACPFCHKENYAEAEVCNYCDYRFEQDQTLVHILESLKEEPTQPKADPLIRRKCRRTRAAEGSLAPSKIVVTNADLGERMEADVLDISALGARILSKKLLSVFTQYLFEFRLRGNHFQIAGEVTRLTKTQNGFEAGVKYSKLIQPS